MAPSSPHNKAAAYAKPATTSHPSSEPNDAPGDRTWEQADEERSRQALRRSARPHANLRPFPLDTH
jgi:hypothetical protein